jgi:prophage maintenance system killer protein
MQKGEIQIYKTSTGTEIQVKLDKETIWLDTHLIASLFEVKRPAIVKHIQNIYKSGELHEKATCSILEQVAADGKKRKMNLYNLDMIISVGYRVNSSRATQFRIWATQRLKDYLVKGYAINEKRLQEVQNRLGELKSTIALLDALAQTKSLSGDEAQGLFKVLKEYTVALDLLDQYDHQTLQLPIIKSKEFFRITYEEAIKAIKGLEKKFGGSALFGKEKDKSLNSSLNTIYQTFNGKELYPGIEHKAAHLLYFIVKNHSFTDGNKRIAAFLFVWFLENNKLLYDNGKKVIDDNALVALTLMVAASKPDDRDMIIKVIVNLIKNKK